tara:strand:- start:572 stop:4714 length:4143 start_codon:yes stop_codon:yes gene_type:complete
MATTESFHNGDNNTVNFNIQFEYLEESDVKVSVGGVLKTQDTDYTIDTTVITFATAPPTGVGNVRIFRDTDINSLRNEFFAGSAIRAQDLNDDFLQTLYTVQEIEDQFVTQTNGSFNTNVDLNSNRITDMADPVNAQDAVTKQYLEDNYFDDGTETITSAESWPDNDTTIATTASIDNRVDSKIDTAMETDVLVDNSGLTKSATGGQVTLGIGEGSVDLDRIKADDIIISGESNPNNDTTIATTAKINDMIDDAITGDILVNGTGLTKTTSGGQTTLGIGQGSVDLDRIKADDIITLAEQNNGPTTDDDSIFTSSAAAKRFDTLVQTSTPTGSYQIGKTWLQNDDDQTLKIWNGTAWLDVASGGSFRTQDKVIYVDKTGGDDTKTGHRISGPKSTIRDAINDINADISVSTVVSDGFVAGSGYADGTYTNVPLTGGTTGSGLTATITVASGAVTTVADVANATLQEYQIGDILSAADSDLGAGGGSGLQIPVIGGGDGMTVMVAAGTYREIAPIQIKRRNVSIIGMALRSCLVHPTVATQGDHADGNHALFELNSGSFVQNLTLTGMQAGNTGTNTLDGDLPVRQGWNFAFYNNAFITKSPYIQNCTNFSDSQIDNSDLNAHNPDGGQAGDLTNAPTGGGMLIDGAVPKTTSPLRSMVADSYTHVGLNGPGILVTNNGYAQCTSSYAFFNKYHIKALNGGQANLAASTTDFGEKALVADGKSTAPIFSGQVETDASDGDITFDVDNISQGTGWFGDDTKPASNMLVTVNSVTYPILSSTVTTNGHRVTISRPNASDRSQNLGLNGDITANDVVQFFLRSQIASSGHTMEYVGSGMDYDALPENGGVPDETKQITELNNGKVWTATTDHNGKFKIGGNQSDAPIFQVDQQLGFVTIPSGSIAFNVVSDTSPELGGNLDVKANEINTSTTNGNIKLNPNGTGVVEVKGAGGNDGTLQLNCSDNSHGVKIKSPSHDDAASYTLTLPTSDGNANQVLKTDGSGALSWVDQTSSYSHPNHTGDVTSTGDGATSIASNAVTTTKIANDAVTADKLADTGVSAATYSLATVTVDAQGRITSAQNGTPDKIGEGNTEAEVVDSGSDGHFKVTTEGIERLKVDNSGRLLVGTSSARGGFDNSSVVKPDLQVEGVGSAAGANRTAISIVNNGSADADSAGLYLARSGGTSVGSFTAVTANDVLARITFNGADGSEFVQAASIEGVIDGTPGSNDMPGGLVFSTTADGAASPQARMTIKNDGKVGIATANPSSTLHVSGTITDSIGPVRRLGITNHNASTLTLAATHAGHLIREATNGANITVPANVFSAGDMITIFNRSSGDNTITQGTNVTLYNTADGSTGNRTLASLGVCTIACTASGEFIINGSGLS